MIRATGRYNWERFLGDCAGGMIAALIALPYGLSMATLMRLPPILGVVTSILTAPITAVLGRNPVLIGGTASATVPFIANAVKAQGIGGARESFHCRFRLHDGLLRSAAGPVCRQGSGDGGGRILSGNRRHHVHLADALLLGVHATNSDNSLVQLFGAMGQIPSMRFAPLLLGGTVMVAAALVMRWSPRLPAPLIGVALLRGGCAWLLPHSRTRSRFAASYSARFRRFCLDP
jgi:SulP family sulfate permease